ncbi:MAG: hypothetical protein OHK0046_12020 [Anaerolineae bacterium]
MRYWVFAVLVLAALLITGCEASSDAQSLTIGAQQPVTGRDLRIVAGQTVYVPAYSEVFIRQNIPNVELSVTLAIHNTDLNNAIIIRSVRYYDTDGTLVRDYITDPVEVAPLATTGFLVEDIDRSGGWGSNFIVEWGAENPVYEPVIEAIMIGTRNAYGISLISPGRVLSQAPEIDN